jgi:transposase, IS5 family
MVEVDRLTGEVARLARQTLRQVQAVVRNARRARGRRPDDGRLGRLVGELEETILAYRSAAVAGRSAACGQPGDPRSAGQLERSGRPADPQGQAQSPTEFGYTLLVAEDERGFVADHQLQQGNPPDAPQLVAGGRGHRAGGGHGGR